MDRVLLPLLVATLSTFIIVLLLLLNRSQNLIMRQRRMIKDLDDRNYELTSIAAYYAERWVGVLPKYAQDEAREIYNFRIYNKSLGDNNEPPPSNR